MRGKSVEERKGAPAECRGYNGRCYSEDDNTDWAFRFSFLRFLAAESLGSWL